MKKPKIETVCSTCCWCDKRIGENQEVLCLGSKKRPGIDLSKYEGDIMQVTMATIDKTLWAIIPTAESDARKEGKDILFTLCSDECGIELKEALNQDEKLGDIIFNHKLN